jgi:uncharacterized membrane protein
MGLDEAHSVSGRFIKALQGSTGKRKEANIRHEDNRWIEVLGTVIVIANLLVVFFVSKGQAYLVVRLYVWQKICGQSEVSLSVCEPNG